MGLIFKVGEHSDFPQIPNNFPKCGSWLPPMDEEETTHSSVTEKVPFVVQDLPYNVTDSTQKFQSGQKERPSTSSDGQESSSNNSQRDFELTTHVPFILAKDEDNFVVPQHLTNGTLSHAESPTIHSTSGSEPLRTSILLLISLPIGYFYSQYVRR
jgi:hypothetical protein